MEWHVPSPHRPQANSLHRAVPTTVSLNVSHEILTTSFKRSSTFVTPSVFRVVAVKIYPHTLNAYLSFQYHRIKFQLRAVVAAGWILRGASIPYSLSCPNPKYGGRSVGSCRFKDGHSD